MQLWTLFCATALPLPVHAADALVRCYLIPWHMVYHAAPKPEQVRQWADVRCTVEAPADFARLRTILRLDRLRPSPPETRDLRLVVDFVRPDGTLETYCADGFNLMSADLQRSRRLQRGFRRDMDAFLRSCSPKSSNHAQRPAPRFVFSLRGATTLSLQPRAVSGAVADLGSR